MPAIWHEFDPDAAYVVCISASPDLLYTVVLQTSKRECYCSELELLRGAMNAALYQELLL